MSESTNLNKSVFIEDMEHILVGCDAIESLRNTTVFVTGATGLIGSLIVKTLAFANEKKNTQINILAFVRSEKKAKRVFGEILDNQSIKLIVGDVDNSINIDSDIDYIIHGASATSSKYFMTNPVETIYTAIDGTRNVLELAKSKNIKGMIILSSLEVYGVPNTEGGYVTETDYGYIDPVSVRSCYSEGKRIVECLCVSYASEYQVPVKIARLSQTFGAGVEYEDSRVFAEFARCAVEKRNIVLHTAGNTLRTYCYIADAVNAIFTILIKGESAQAYNVTNADTAVTIREMAQVVCDAFPESEIEVEFDLPDDIASFGYNPEMVIRLQTEKLESLGWHATTNLEEMFKRMVKGF